MNISKNTIPDRIQKVHFIGVCGTMMGALACMMKDLGFDVTGSDQAIYPPMSDFLRDRGVCIFDGFDGRHLSDKPDLVVVGNAITKINPEVESMFALGLHYCSMPQAIHRFIASGKKAILVAGTHGKTTTSSIVSWILHKAGLDPTFFIGGIVKNFMSNYHLGRGDYVVIEGDEYDTAFFDKGPKFLHYDPFMAILTSVEFDHADIFKDIDAVRHAFDCFLTGISANSILVAFDDDQNIKDLICDRSYPVVWYGKHSLSDWQLGSVSIEPPWSIYTVIKGNSSFGTFKTRLIGQHNLLNSLSAIAVAEKMNIPKTVIADALESFEGIKRRQEIRGQKNGITIMDDFAHHPTAVLETINGVKPFFPHGRLIAVFEPRTNSSRRNVFQNIYPHSFQQADIICIQKPSALEKIPPDERFSSEKLVQDLTRCGKKAYHFSDTDSIIDFLVQSSRSGDLILIMSSGGFDNIHERLLAAL